jgi:hypothetical protein
MYIFKKKGKVKLENFRLMVELAKKNIFQDYLKFRMKTNFCKIFGVDHNFQK